MQQIGESWLMYRLTGSATLLGAIGFAGLFPVLVLGPYAGYVADKYDRRRILIITQTAAMVLAFILSALTLTHLIHEWHLFALATCLGIVNAFDMPARQAFIVQVVEREDLVNAIALNSTMFNGARIVGPAIAGLVVAAVGEGWCFFANGVSYIAVVFCLVIMRAERPATPASEASAIQNIIEGFRYVGTTAPVRALLILIGVVSFTGMPYAVLMPIFADRILHAGPSGMGILMGAAGIGALLSSVAMALRQSVKGLGRWVMLAALFFGISLIGFALSRWFIVSAIMLVPVGASMMMQMASSNTLIQSMVPDELRGRVMAVYSMMFLGIAPFGSLLAGVISNRIGAPYTLAGGGAICIIASLIFGMRLPLLRGEARRLILAQRAVPGEPAAETTPTGAEAYGH
ncbi:MAG: major facilitator superfamily transporter [Acidobacteria bacterium]|nr:major facilitator superfamily transporter [Acidobacteriota bacterium]